MKVLDINQSVYELTQTYPELIPLMAQLGFKEIEKKTVRHSVGRLFTLPQGAKMKGIALDKVLETLQANGFTLKKTADTSTPPVDEKKINATPPEGKTEQIKDYLLRLNQGEDLASVQRDFAQEFSEVSADEIMRAEQEIMDEGTPLQEVQRLCDLHSSLFHGHTENELHQTAQADENVKKLQQLLRIKGHPLHRFTQENQHLHALLNNFKKQSSWTLDDVAELRQTAIHYAKKGDLLYPLLKVKYGISGPANVMWTVDDEIRDELSTLAKVDAVDENWKIRLQAVMQRMEEMIYKEENILFAICAAHFTDNEWRQMYRDMQAYPKCWNITAATWEAAETEQLAIPTTKADGIVISGGELTLAQLTAMLNTMPMEITFVDAEDINRYFNEGEKCFMRPSMALGRNVFSCHPPKIEPIVRSIIEDFRHARRDKVGIWMRKNGREMYVQYLAVRHANGNYLGTLELVQDMEFAKAHFTEQN